MKEGKKERKKILQKGLKETTVLVGVLLSVKRVVTSPNLTLIHIK